MIDLTPLDVRNKRGDFKKGMRGYDPQEVDVFLELVAERLEALVRENIQLRDRTQTLQQQVDAQTGREQAVQDALVTAQELREDIRAQSQREADHVIREAESEARRMIAEADAEVRSRLRGVQRQVDHARDSLQDLERRRSRFLQEFRNLLQRELDVVEVEEGRVPLEDRTIDLDLGPARSIDQRERVSGASATAGEATDGTDDGVAEMGGTDAGEDGVPGDEASAPASGAPQGQTASATDAESGPAPAADASDDETIGSASASSGGGDARASAPDGAREVAQDRASERRARTTPEAEGTEAATGTEAAGDTGSARDAETDGGTGTPPDATAAREATGTGHGGGGSNPSAGAAGTSAEPAPDERRAALDADVGELSERGDATAPRKKAPAPEVGDGPTSLELELMAGAAGSDAGEGGGGTGFPDVPDLETVLAEAGIDEVKLPEAEEILPPPADRSAEDRLALFDDDGDEDEEKR